MLNSNLNSSSLSSNTNDNQNRVDDLMNTILEARKSLQNWEDQKTEALIKLDALTYDIRLIGEEKDRAKENADIIRKEMQSEIRVYQSHVDNLSDQVTLLQIEREGLQNQLTQALAENQNYLKDLARLKASELKLQDDLKFGLAAMQNETEVRMSAKFEAAYGEEIQALRLQVQELNAQHLAIMNHRNDAEERANQYERELGGIRSHMMSVLRVADGANSHPANANAARRNESRAQESRAIENRAETKKLHPVEIESTSVDEYLKRLGY